MKIEYNHGARVTQQTHEMTFLESETCRYEALAKEHYALESKSCSLVKDEREARLKRSLDHLECQRRKIDTIIDVQTKLDEYRKQGDVAINGTPKDQTAGINVMMSERHHPTAALETYMLGTGVVKPSPEHTAHHIVPGKGKLPRVTYIARLHLHRHGIRINDPANGVYLVSKDKDTPHWSMPNSGGHKKYHTHGYERWVTNKIRPIKGAARIKTELQVIGRMLQNNPPEAMRDK